MYLFPTRSRRIAGINLELCLPDLTPRQRSTLVRHSLIEFWKTLLESPLLWMGNTQRVLNMVTQLSGEDHMKAGMARKKGVILVIPHLGNWEMVGQYCSHFFPPMTSMFRPQRSKSLDHIVQQVRERHGARLVPSTQTGLRHLLQTLHKGGCLGILPDQNPGAGTGIYVPFFGVSANTPVFAARLANKTGATVLITWAERLAWGRGFRVHFSPANDEIAHADVSKAVSSMNRDIEEAILSCVEQYWWSYNRFRHRPPGEPKIY